MDARTLFLKTGLFEGCSEDQLQQLIQQSSKKMLVEGQNIVYEGDPASAFYLIEQGICEVYTHDDQYGEVVLAELPAESFFGEQALVTSWVKQRNASVRAKSDVTLIEVPYHTFQEVIQTNRDLQKAINEIGHKQLLEKLRVQSTKLCLANNLFDGLAISGIKKMKSGERVFSQGDAADSVYYIEEGLVDIIISDENGNEQLVGKMGPGNIFGEFGVVGEQPRKASIVADSDVQLKWIEADRFKKFYIQNALIKRHVDALMQTYQIASRGQINRFVGQFLDMEAVVSDCLLKDASRFISCAVLGKDIAMIQNLGYPQFEKIIFTDTDKEIVRELMLHKNLLVGLCAYGPWQNLADAFSLVFDQVTLEDSVIHQFQINGELLLTSESAPINSVCKCLKLSAEDIKQYIEKGANSLQAICDKTGAGITCGACIPKIRAILQTGL